MPGSVVALLTRAGLFGDGCGGWVVRFDDGGAVVSLDGSLDLDDLVGRATIAKRRGMGARRCTGRA